MNRRWPQALAALLTAAAITAGAATSAHPARLTDLPVQDPATLSCGAPFVPLGAPQLQHAYGAGPMLGAGIDGTGTTIATLVPVQNPYLSRSLAVYSRRYGLPAPRLRTIDVPGAPAPGSVQDGPDWVDESTEDLEMMHVLAPRATLMYVAAPSGAGYFDTLLASLVAAEHPTVVSYSSALPEVIPGIAASRSGLQAAAQAGTTVVAGTGDWGPTAPDLSSGILYPRPVAVWPASDPLVTAVGGTWLHLDRAGHRLHPDTAFSDAGNDIAGGGALSAVFPRPAWQDAVRNVVGSHRGVADIAMDGSECSAVAVYEHAGSTYQWTHSQGTSMAGPLLAALVADAAQLAGHRLGVLGPALYSLRGPADGIMDVTQGSNSVPGVTGYPATPGYDLPTGIGTVAAALPFITALARAAQHTALAAGSGA